MFIIDEDGFKPYLVPSYVWERRVSIWPRRCCFSGKKLSMFRYAYRGVRKTMVPHLNQKFASWATSETYLFKKIKGEL